MLKDAGSPPSGGAWNTIHAPVPPELGLGHRPAGHPPGDHGAALDVQVEDQHPDAGPLRA